MLTGCAPGIRWHPDLPQGRQAARADSRPMLLYFWDWLSPDRARMETQVFSDPRVVAAMHRTANVRLEYGWFRDLARQYDVQTVPTFVLTSPEGVEQARLTGVPSPDAFLSWLQDALPPPTTKPTATETPPTPAATVP